VKRVWWLVIASLLGVALFVVFGFFAGKHETLKLDENVTPLIVSFEIPGLEISINPVDVLMLEASLEIPSGATNQDYTVSVVKALEKIYLALEKNKVLPEKIRMNIRSGDFRKTYVFDYQDVVGFFTGKIDSKQFWTASLKLDTAPIEMINSKAKLVEFAKLFRTLTSFDAKLDGTNITVIMTVSDKPNQDWIDEVAQAMLALYVCANDTKTSIGNVSILVSGLDRPLKISFKYRYLRDYVEGKIPKSEFDKYLELDSKE